MPEKDGKRPLTLVRLGTRAMPLLPPGGAILEGTARPGWQGGISPLRIAPKRKSREGAAAVPFIAPNEIRNTHLNAALFGYDREQTDALLSGIEASYERVWLEREELRAQVLQLQEEVREHDKLRAQLERIEPELDELRKVDSLLRSALVSAERTTEKLKQEARSEAETAVRRARKRADEINGRAQGKRRRLELEIERLEGVARRTKEECRELLTQALETIEGSAAPPATPTEEPKEEPKKLPTPLGHHLPERTSSSLWERP
jgi:cell division initiation protein